jgi:division protein CdvB (Snf7/Vps24/ESCRT-III family)
LISLPNFQNKWNKQYQPGIGDKINEALKPKGPLKPQVQNGIKRLQTQIAKLDSMITKLNERDGKLFQRIVEATQSHDVGTTKVLSKELAEVRKVAKILGNARIALEQIELRLTTYHDLGDTVVTIMPTIGLMKNLKSSLSKFMPGADQEINQMAQMLGGFMTDSFSSEGSFGIDESTNSESEKILQEAAAVAESSTGQMFPSVPADTRSSTSTKSSKFY